MIVGDKESRTGHSDSEKTNLAIVRLNIYVKW